MHSILITVDVEDWFQVENLRPSFPLSVWDSCELRIERNVDVLLNLFEQHNVQATFFVLGWIAEKCPELIKNVSRRGHEIACHGYNHQLCSTISRQVLRDDLYRSKALLEDITGQKVFGYRAPSFSITEDLIEILGDLSYSYDSSFNSFGLNKRYGKAKGMFMNTQRNILVAHNGVIELPVSNLSVAGKSVPWSGGGYFRFWPSMIFHYGVNHILKNSNYYIFYCHPWEIDDGQPRVTGLGSVSRFRHYLNLDKTLDRLSGFLTRFNGHKFIPCNRYVNSFTA